MMYKKIMISLLAAFAAFSASVSAEYNKYNEENFINISNQTIADVAAEFNMSVEEFKKNYELPDDMPEDTNETAAYYHLTIKNYAKLLGTSAEDLLAELKSMTSSEDNFDENTLWKDAESKIPISEYMKDAEGQGIDMTNVYLGAVPKDTPFGDVRTKLFRKVLAESKMLSYFNDDSILVMLNGKYIDFDTSPVIINDRTLVPLRGVFEKMGAAVNWYDDTKTVMANKGDRFVIMQVGQDNMFVDNQKIDLDSPAVITNDRTLVPLRAVAEAFDAEVFYNPDTKTVVIH